MKILKIKQEVGRGKYFSQQFKKIKKLKLRKNKQKGVRVRKRGRKRDRKRKEERENHVFGENHKCMKAGNSSNITRIN